MKTTLYQRILAALQQQITTLPLSPGITATEVHQTIQQIRKDFPEWEDVLRHYEYLESCGLLTFNNYPPQKEQALPEYCESCLPPSPSLNKSPFSARLCRCLTDTVNQLCSEEEFLGEEMGCLPDDLDAVPPITYETHPVSCRHSDLLSKPQAERQEVFSSVYALTEVKPGTRMLTEIFLHLEADTAKVTAMAQEAQPFAERRYNTPLDLLVKQGEKITLNCSLYSKDRCLTTYQHTVVWRGHIVRCGFDYLVPEDLPSPEIFCRGQISVNGAVVGEIRFTTQVIAAPRPLHTAVNVHKYQKVFLSYARKDWKIVRLIALAYEVQGIDYFFDLDRLSVGDIYEQKIFDFIDTADLFMLFWSQHAAESANVAREKQRALARAYPQVSREEATLSILPFSIQPYADFPEDMKGIYQFGIL